MMDFQNVESDDGFYEVDYEKVTDTDLQNLPDDITIHIVSGDFPESYISSEGKYYVIQIERNVPSYEGDEKKTKAQANELLQSVKDLTTQKTPMAEESIYHNNGSTFVHWTYRVFKTMPSAKLLDDIKVAVKNVMARTSIIAN